jgi:membrane protease YdiL (CAAX protease family)
VRSGELSYFIFLHIYTPLYSFFRGKWQLKDIGLTLKVNSMSVAVFAVVLGALSGLAGYTSNQAVVSSDPISAGTLIILLFNNDFSEEFFHRGIIQSRLERALGQSRAVLVGGLLFGNTHITFDIKMLMSDGIIFVVFAFIIQCMLGWLLGIIYLKTRSLWSGISLQYLVNWLPSIRGS